MRFYADESCDYAVVRALRSAGHDVAAVAEERPGLTDREVMTRAEESGRVVVTEDKDFGQLVFSGGAGAVGCLFLRYPAALGRGTIGADVVRVVETLGDRIRGSFVTAEPGKVRITRLPDSA